MKIGSKKNGLRLRLLAGLATVSLFVLAWAIAAKNRSQHTSPVNLSLAGLLAMQPESLQRVDIGEMNLLCAQGLPGAEQLDIPACLRTLDQWTEHVRSETQRHWYRFEQNPAEFEHSEGYFRMLMLAVVLEEDFRVRYDPDRRINPQNASSSDDFFADSSDVFMHGLLGPKRQGTCSSMPVLTVAVGRRLV